MVLLVDDAEEIPTQSKVERKLWALTKSVLHVTCVRVLESKSIGVTTRGPATAQCAREKVGERTEIQATTISRIEELVHRRASKFVTKLQVVSHELPRKVIDHLIIDVGTRAWDR